VPSMLCNSVPYLHNSQNKTVAIPPVMIFVFSSLICMLLIKFLVWILRKLLIFHDSQIFSVDPEARVRFPALPDSLRSSGSGKGSIQPREYN
jgi:type IV secretory pathway VirB3-like protein